MKLFAKLLILPIAVVVAQEDSNSTLPWDSEFGKMILRTYCCADAITNCIHRCGQCIPGWTESTCGDYDADTNSYSSTCDISKIVPNKDESYSLGTARDSTGALCQADTTNEDGDSYCWTSCGLSSGILQLGFRECLSYPGADGAGGSDGMPACATGAETTFQVSGDDITEEDLKQWLNETFPNTEFTVTCLTESLTSCTISNSGRKLAAGQTYTAEGSVGDPNDLAALADFQCQETYPDSDSSETTAAVAASSSGLANEVTIAGQTVSVSCEKQKPALPEDPCADVAMAGGIADAVGIGFLGDIAAAATGCPASIAEISVATSAIIAAFYASFM